LVYFNINLNIYFYIKKKFIEKLYDELHLFIIYYNLSFYSNKC